MLKYLELQSPSSCLNKAAADEPVFVLRANDRFAAQTIRLWAAMSHGNQPVEKLEAAMAAADEMEKYHAMKYPNVAEAPRAASLPQHSNLSGWK